MLPSLNFCVKEPATEYGAAVSLETLEYARKNN